MEYVILLAIFLFIVILFERAVSTVEVYELTELKERKYHKYSEADMNILNNKGISNQLASELIGVSISSIRNKRKRINN